MRMEFQILNGTECVCSVFSLRRIYCVCSLLQFIHIYRIQLAIFRNIGNGFFLCGTEIPILNMKHNHNQGVSPSGVSSRATTFYFLLSTAVYLVSSAGIVGVGLLFKQYSSKKRFSLFEAIRHRPIEQMESRHNALLTIPQRRSRQRRYFCNRLISAKIRSPK